MRLQRNAHAAIHDKVSDMDYMLIPPELDVFLHKPLDVYIQSYAREQNEHFDAFEKEEVTICLCIITCQVRQAYLIQYALTPARGLAEVHRLVLED